MSRYAKLKTFNSLVNKLLVEMAIENNSDIVYLSQLTNQSRNDASGYENSGIGMSLRRLTSKGFPKAIRNHFGAKLKYPIRIVVDDVNDEQPHSHSRTDVTQYIKPTPGVITFYIHPELGNGDLATPFLVGHNLGHTLRHLQKDGEFNNFRGDEMTPFDTVTYAVIEDIINKNPELSWFSDRVRQYRNDDPLWMDGPFIKILTPNLANISEGYFEWQCNLVAVYMKYGRIKFRVGSADKIEQFIDNQLQSWIGRSIAIG